MTAIIVPLSVLWFLFEPGFEPLIGIMSAIIALPLLREREVKPEFSVQVSDTYYHRNETHRKKVDFLGIIFNIDNYRDTSAFIRDLEITLKFGLASFEKINLFQLLIYLKYKYAASYTVAYPANGSSSFWEQGWLVATPARILGYPPACWVFDRRSETIIELSTPFEIHQNRQTMLWELIIYLPSDLWSIMDSENLSIQKVEVLFRLNDGSLKTATTNFEPRFGREASSREKIYELLGINNSDQLW